MENLKFEAEGYECLVKFVNDSHYCGYVGIPKTHPAFGENYYTHSIDLDDICENLIKKVELLKSINNIEVHGGLTYCEKSKTMNKHCDDDDKFSEGLWLFGFDAAHAWDKKTYNNADDATFKDKEYMKEQCERLAKQLKEIEEKYSEQN